MKKIIILFFFITSMQNLFAQSSNIIRDSLYQALKKAKTPSEQVKTWGQISEYYGYTANTDSCRLANEKMLKIATTTQQDSLLAKAYLEIGLYFSNASDYKQALEFEFKSLALAKKYKNNYDIWLATKEVGNSFKKLKNYEEALRYLKRAESFINGPSLKGSHKNSGFRNRTYTHLSEVYLALDKPESALRYIQLTNEVTSKDKDAYGYARMLYIFATIYKVKGDRDLAESYYKKCILFSDAENIYAPYVTATTDYGQFLLDTKQYNVSKEYALSGFNKAKEAKDKLGVIDAAALLHKVYYAIGQKDSSYFYADVKDVYNDSVFNEQQLFQIQNISFSQKLKEKEEQAKLSEEVQQQKENLQYIFIAIGILTGIILFLLLSRSFITNTKLIQFFGIVGLLIVFEFLNLLLHPFLEKVTHHSPILMLLGLVGIASLLVPLHHKVEHWATAKLVAKNKEIRIANAKKTIEELDKKTEN
jgi:tetratricopeptide (TPR) repeat protein